MFLYIQPKRVYRMPGFLPVVRIGSPHFHTPQESVAYPTPPVLGGRHTRLRGRGWQDPIRTTGQKLQCSVLYTIKRLNLNFALEHINVTFCVHNVQMKDGYVTSMYQMVYQSLCNQHSLQRLIRCAYPIILIMVHNPPQCQDRTEKEISFRSG